MMGRPVPPDKPRSLRVAVAIALGRAAGAISRLSGRGGTAIPGLIAERIAPNALAHLARQIPGGVVIVTGTNGKTTTSHLVREIVAHAGWPVIHNASGSNLPRGLLATLMATSGWRGDVRVPVGTIAVLETDEAAVARVLASTGARVLVVTNLFRDQLDRYGEVDAVRDRWRGAIEAIPAYRRPALVLNVDDPAVAGLAACAGPAGVVPFGVADQTVGQDAPDHAADATQCPLCGNRLLYDRVTYGHLGKWRCLTGHARPQLAVSANAVALGSAGVSFALNAADEAFPVRLAIPGLYNVYNAVSAAATSMALGVPTVTAVEGIERFRGAFGRFERVDVGGRTVVVVLAKNPVGMNEALRAVAAGGEMGDLLLALNDLDADGRDISWIWDADFEVVAGRSRRVTVAGRRADELAMRLAYAGVGAPDDPEVRREVVEDIEDALDQALAGVAIGGTVVAVVTYTAMLELRHVLVTRGHAAAHWDDAGATGVVGTGVAHRKAKTPDSTNTPAGRANVPMLPSAVQSAPASGTGFRGEVPRTPHVPPNGPATSLPLVPDALSSERSPARPVLANGGTSVRGTPPRVRVGHLYADLLNLYADRGNVLSLRRRCEWRGIDFEIVPLGIGDRIVPGTVDLAFMGGGQDGDQAFLADDLFRVKADGIRGLVADGVPLLAVCGSYQLLGHYYDPSTGPRLPGLGVFDLHTAHPGPQASRCIGNVVVEWGGAPDLAPRTLVGFENHGGRTWLGSGATPFARVAAGYGNNGSDRTEGIVVGNAIGTYIHGALLPKNPHLADWLIALALDPSGTTELEPLDDAVEWRAHETVLGRFAPSLRRSTEGRR